MYQEKDGEVVITLSRADFDLLLLALGYATGAALERDPLQLSASLVFLVNRINEGNPAFTRYEVNG